MSDRSPWLVAPDFGFAVGPTPERTLRELRGRLVLLVLFTLPGSRQRLHQLAESHPAVQAQDGEIIAVPSDDGPAILRRLGASPAVLFPVVTEGVPPIATTYALIGQTRSTPWKAHDAGPPHAEWLIDRQGYVRARFVPGVDGPGWNDLRTLLDQMNRLARETSTTPPADEHAH